MRRRATLLLCAFLMLGAACTSRKPAVEVDSARLGIFKALPRVMDSAANPISEEKAVLGRMLYYDARLSRGQDVSCNSCHELSKYGVDNQPVSDGDKGQKGTRNAPTVYNAAGHFVQFWDGRAPTVEEQAKGPILNPVEMAMPDEKRALAVVNSMPEYVAAFQKAFPGEKHPVTFDNLAKAIGAFERKLVTVSRWDKFLGGGQAALSDAEKAGLNMFLDAGCQNCHNGIYVGGSMFQKLGLAKPWDNTNDQGRFAVTKLEADRMVFKVPTLRNIEKTAPYYHDGSIATLEEAVRQMADHQLARTLSKKEVGSISTFLKALTGELPTEYIQEPPLPKSTAKTPKPDKA
ncbi:MAG: cytochrome c peroxidase [Bryobacteraceae bacterium]|jgi:cytochrome c peroxidase